MSSEPFPTRRDFLTGRAAQDELRKAGDALGDAVLGDPPRPEPRAYETVRLETRAMACPWSVIMEPGDPARVMLASDALSIVHEIEAQLSVYRESSEISRINRDAANGELAVQSDVARLLQTCADYTRETQGAFDAAVRPLILLWRACRGEGRIPTDAEVAGALAATGMKHVACDPEKGTVRFDRPGVGLDLGAIGKGYAVDRAVAHLLASGLSDFVLHGGHSSLLARGDHHGQGGWPVGIKNPLFTDARYATILLRDQAFATSGSNVQFFRHEGRKYGHILDPRSGWPASGLLSVSVVAPTAAQADALSTAFYVMGLEKAVEYCDTHSAIGALLIPIPAHGRRLQPVICNIPADVLYPVADPLDETAG